MQSWNFSEISIKKLHAKAQVPTRAHPGDAGLDLTSVEDVVLGPSRGVLVPTGLAFALPPGFVGMIADRSSMGKKGIKVAGGIIDAGYRGEVKVILWNLSQEEIHLKTGDRIAQILILPIATPASIEVQELDSTARGAGGFGSTGK